MVEFETESFLLGLSSWKGRCVHEGTYRRDQPRDLLIDPQKRSCDTPLPAVVERAFCSKEELRRDQLRDYSIEFKFFRRQTLA